MKSKEFIYLAVMTVFAVLFLVSFRMYVSQKHVNEILKDEIKAYDLFISGRFEDFVEFARSRSLKLSRELSYYTEKFAQLELSTGRSDYEMANYGSALRRFERVLDLDVPESIKHTAKLMMGRTYYEMGEYEKAYGVLREFLEDARDFRGRGEALVELAKVCVKLKKFDELELIKRELRSDPRSLEKIQRLEDEIE